MKKLSPKGYEKLISFFRSLSGARSLWECFNDCINLFSLSFQNFSERGDAFRKGEEEYKQIIGKYKKEEQELIFHIFAELSIKHYYGYTMAEAKRKYREDTRIFKNHRRRKNA